MLQWWETQVIKMMNLAKEIKVNLKFSGNDDDDEGDILGGIGDLVGKILGN